MAKKKDFNIFYILDAICNTKEDITDHAQFEKEYNIFMINKWLSMHKHTIWAAYFADQIRKMSKKQHFYFVSNFIEKKRIFFRFKKGRKKAKDLKIIMDYYNISEEKAKDLVNILDKKQIKSLNDAFGGRKK